jgi:hypothetical protein
MVALPLPQGCVKNWFKACVLQPLLDTKYPSVWKDIELVGTRGWLLEEKVEKETSKIASFFSMARKPLSKQRRGTVTSCIMNMIALDYQPFSIKFIVFG